MEILKNKWFWCIVLICVVTLFPFLGMAEYNTKGEPREAIVSYSMITGDNWILPRNNGGEMAYKPPFFHWCVAAVSSLWGDVTEATSRIPSALSLMVMVVMTFVFYQRHRSTHTAMLAALVTMTSFELHRAGANCRVDMVLTSMIVLAIYMFFRWYERGRHGIPWFAVLFMALATLTKGPVGSILPCLVMGVFMLMRRHSFFKTFGMMMACGLLSLSLYALWFYAAWQQGGDEFVSLVYEENIGRMTGTMTYSSHEEPVIYNFITVIAGYLPWTLLCLFALVAVNYRRMADSLKEYKGWQKVSFILRKTISGIRNLDDTDLYSFLALTLIFVFYCIPTSKRSVYLMPIYPFLGYFIARMVQWLYDTKRAVIGAYCSVLSAITTLLVVAFIVVTIGLIPDSIFGSGRHAEANISMLNALAATKSWWQYVVIAITSIVGLLWWRYRRHENCQRHLPYVAVVLVLSLYLSLDGVYTPTVLNSKSVKAAAMAIDRHVPQSEGVLYEYVAEGMLVKGNPLHFFEVNFYLHNRIDNFYEKRPKEGFLLISKKDAEQAFPEFTKEGYLFTPHYDVGKRGMMIYRFVRN
ncbi:MAG: glycosyltransferase family 39 protein [Prevotella sp.]|nr:glycosyltransferase family 39 protein [Prevotella sp.]